MGLVGACHTFLPTGQATEWPTEVVQYWCQDPWNLVALSSPVLQRAQRS